MKDRDKKADANDSPKFIEGEHFYYDSGLMVLTAKFLLERGYCCGNSCRHCPYSDEEKVHQSKKSSRSL